MQNEDLSNPARYVKKSQLASHLGVSTRTINYWMARRVIPFLKIGKLRLFDVAAVERALKRFEVKSIGE